VHAAKGLEFDVVFASGMEEGLFPYESHVSQGEVEEERRLFYVALTRARKKVVVSWARSRARFGEWSFSKMSRFVGEIPDSLLSRGEAPRRRSFGELMGSEMAPALDPARARPRRARPTAPPPRGGGAPETRRGHREGSASEAAAAPSGGGAPEARRGHREGLAVPGPSWTGKRVHHRAHGDGRVLAVVGSGAKALVVVRFEESSTVTTVPAGSLQLLP